MKNFKVNVPKSRLFSLLVTTISKVESLIFRTRDSLKIIANRVIEIKRSEPKIKIISAITAESVQRKRIKNILLRELLSVNARLKQSSKMQFNIVSNIILKLNNLSIKFLRFDSSSFIKINAVGTDALFRPFGGLPDNPYYNEDGLDNRTFAEIDSWTFMKLDRIR